MKNRMLVAALVIGLLTIGGSRATAQGPDPTLAPAPSYQPMPAADTLAAVNGYLDAFGAKRWSTLPSLTCSLERDSIASSYDPAAQTFLPREVVQALYDALVVEIIDRSVTLVSSDTDSATVRLDGTLA